MGPNSLDQCLCKVSPPLSLPHSTSSTLNTLDAIVSMQTGEGGAYETQNQTHVHDGFGSTSPGLGEGIPTLSSASRVIMKSGNHYNYDSDFFERHRHAREAEEVVCSHTYCSTRTKVVCGTYECTYEFTKYESCFFGVWKLGDSVCTLSVSEHPALS